MKRLLSAFLIGVSCSCLVSQEKFSDQIKVKEDLSEILRNISQNYIYLEDKSVDLDCIKAHYEKQIPFIKTEEQTVLFFEYLLDEFYDSHLILNTNRRSSYRLYSPIYVTIKEQKPIISNVWISQTENPYQNVVGAEVLKINGIDINRAMEDFPTHCHNKNSLAVREWIVNKILAGRYNKPRVITIKMPGNKPVEIDLDKITIKAEKGLLTSSIENEIGIIRINNSLGNNNLISTFDKALDKMMDTKGLIIDLRNTVDGGNSYVARGIMGRFISETKPYQKHWTIEQFDEKTSVERTWLEYVSPRKQQYKQPVVILVGRWTGSMGEGLAIGFEGIERAQIVGTEMERLAGEMTGFTFKNQPFGYRLSTAKLYHINGTPREEYIPTNYVEQATTDEDLVLIKGIEMISEMQQ
ncbi:S41 family peptidase [Carboxylicivirga sp. RSCT41]|uniref:S41 family peptidase n=1 Tax=Carboxylicivirga agarovorans TaxID=3417570 RepID=UPI003D355DA5